MRVEHISASADVTTNGTHRHCPPKQNLGLEKTNFGSLLEQALHLPKGGCKCESKVVRVPSWWQFAIKRSKLQTKQEAARKDQQLKFKKKALCTAVNPIQENWPRPPNKSEKATRDFCGMTYLVNLGSVNSANGPAMEVNEILFDTGANCCISKDRNNFVGTFTPMELGAVDGIGKGLTVAGEGQVAWTFRGDNGMLSNIEAPMLLRTVIKHKNSISGCSAQNIPW